MSCKHHYSLYGTPNKPVLMGNPRNAVTQWFCLQSKLHMNFIVVCGLDYVYMKEDFNSLHIY